jgi:hypothetical protein
LAILQLWLVEYVTGKKAGPPATVLTCHLPAMLGGVLFVSAGNSPLVDANDTIHTYGNL